MNVEEYEADLIEVGYSGQHRLFARNKYIRFSLVSEVLANFFNPKQLLPEGDNSAKTP